jgi:hypothetical protein
MRGTIVSINLATIIYLMNSPLTGKDSIKFGEDYKLCVLQEHPNFFYQDLRRELTIGHISIIFV